MDLCSVGRNKKIYTLLLQKNLPPVAFLQAFKCLPGSSNLQNTTSPFWFSFMSCD